MSVEIKSFNQILGSMVRKIIAETPVSDVNPGSVFLSLLEACASNDFENNVAILNILELLSVDSIRNSDLDKKAADLGLSRQEASVASGPVTIFNTNIQKQSTSLYALKAAPTAGQTVLFVNNTRGWAASGNVYIGRGTTSFEGPIPYTSIQTYATYSKISLGAALQKNHLISDLVVNSQGQADRLISAGTVVKIPANNQSAEILYSTLRDAVIPAGEDRVENVLVVAQVPGTRGNALVNTIRQFSSLPFAGAAVLNTQAFSSGVDVETDVQLRNRIKSYAASLARGTSAAILNAVIGLSDPDENKRVASATLTNPVAFGEPSILYVDDGAGFQPSYAGQAVDQLITNANGTEEFLQLANYPLTRPQVTNNAIGPFVLADQMFFRVAVDGEEDSVLFETADFLNIVVATSSEVVAALNAKATLFKARLDNNSNNILVYPVDPDAETIQVVPMRSTDNELLYANAVLNFPTKEASYIALYQNSTRLRQRNRAATVQTIPFAGWSLLADGNLILSVDGTPAQNGAFTLADFPGFASYALLTLDDWVRAVNAKFAGIVAEATPSQTMKISSNKSGSAASIEVVGGTYRAPMFSTNTMSAVGQASQFEINRQTGNIRVLTDIEAGDAIAAGITDAKGSVVSTPTASGLFNFDADSAGRPSELIVVTDATKCNRVAVNLRVGDQLTFSSASGMKILASTLEAFKNIQPGHYIYIASRTSNWTSASNTGLFRVIARGPHTSAGVDSWILVRNNNIAEEVVIVADVLDVCAFDTDAYPQVWRSSLLAAPTAATLVAVIDSFNQNIRGVRASTFRTTAVKLTSTTEIGGSIAIPVSIGRMAAIFPATATIKSNNDPLVATKIPQKDMVGFPKLASVVSGNAFLSRAAYSFVCGPITTLTSQDPPPYSGAHSEVFEVASFAGVTTNVVDHILFTRGDNKGLFRTMATRYSTTKFGTQQGFPRTAFDHTINTDEVLFVQGMRFNGNDNIVWVMDNDPASKTIDIGIARTGQINSGSAGGSFTPTSTEFSANDYDNEAGVDFGTTSVWGTTLNGTDFKDYGLLMRARNWYASGGTAANNGKFIVRCAEFGSNGNKLRFAIEYPSLPEQTKTTNFAEFPSYSILNYYFGSDVARGTTIPANTTVTVTGPYNSTSVNFPGGANTGTGNYWDLEFGGATLTGVQVGDIWSALTGSGFTGAMLGQFSVQAISGTTIRIFSRTALSTSVIGQPDMVSFFPLMGTAVSDIVEEINNSNILVAAAVGSPGALITKSTREDQYTFVNSATALAYGHNPTSSTLSVYVALYDGSNQIKKFQNANPNFTTKNTSLLTASGVSGTVYAMHTAPNEDGSVGEYFKLIPGSVDGVRHHFTQKTLSQLPILSEINLANQGTRVQVISKQLGSAGGIQVIGGQANAAQTAVLGDSQVVADATDSYILASVSAVPNAFQQADIVKVQNRAGVKRLSRLATSDKIDITADGNGLAEYLWDAKTTNFGAGTTIAITDVSANYSMSAGMVFRWTHSAGSGETLATVVPGDVVAAYDVAWDQTNMARLTGDGRVSGLPIIAVSDASHYFDVVCPFGVIMNATAIGAGSVKIFPTPRIRWNLAHVAPVAITDITVSGNVVSVVCAQEHFLNTNDQITLRDSNIVTDGTYTVTVTSASEFSFAAIENDATEGNIGATFLNAARVQTLYRLEKLGINNLVRISLASGDSPRFADSGVAVDDYIVLSGTTFNSLNNGTYRVVAVDNDSVTFENPNAVECVTTVLPVNEVGTVTSWTANSATVTGAAGAFKNLSDGYWIKKEEDPDSRYLQVLGSNTGSYATATSITLGGTYGGITGTSLAVYYNQETGFEAGVRLNNANDIIVYEGDAVLNGDTLSVQNITHASWFATANTGNFTIIETGSATDHRPFVRVENAASATETNRLMSVNTQGLYITESDAHKYYSYRRLTNSCVSTANELQRSLYMMPDSRSYKISEANGTFITHMGRLGFDLNTSIGTDGYLYYTGLMRRVQRTVDGYGPDSINFPERRAIGSRIEALPPLIKDLSLALTITTNNGATIQDVANNVKSAIVDHINNLGVGQDVILSAIIAKVMQVRGVAAVTFTTPAASVERISVAANEKAIIAADNIGLN